MGFAYTVFVQNAETAAADFLKGYVSGARLFMVAALPAFKN